MTRHLALLAVLAVPASAASDPVVLIHVQAPATRVVDLNLVGPLRERAWEARGVGDDSTRQGHALLPRSWWVAPWRDTRRLRQLVVDYAAQRATLLAQTVPNPRTEREWRGPFARRLVQRCARLDARRPFRAVADELLDAGVTKTLDVNLVWVLERWPRLPTLEFRAVGGSLDVDVVLARLGAVEDFLRAVARRADARR